MAKTGGMASGVPGEIRGYEVAHAAYGKLSWKRLFQPSIDLARNGFVVTALLAQRLTNIESLVKSDPLWAESYLVHGRLAQEGDTIYRRRLADTLQAVADGGADGAARPFCCLAHASADRPLFPLLPRPQPFTRAPSLRQSSRTWST